MGENDFQKKIKELRISTGMNRKEFCAKFGIPYQTMTEWELGQRNAPDYLLRLLSYYVLTQDYFQKNGIDEENILKGDEVYGGREVE